MKPADFWFAVDRKAGFMKRQRKEQEMPPPSPRLMPVPTPVLPTEVEEMWQKYFAEFQQQMPGVEITPTATQCMRDAFYHGTLAIIIRNAPEQKKEIVQ